MNKIYTLSIYIYGLSLKLAALFHPKARKWVVGRKGWRGDLRKHLAGSGELIWFHCASLGEFEQGRNLIDDIKINHPQYQILITFFSPSGYAIRKKYKHADHVAYLPLDTPSNVKDFLDIGKPVAAFFIKYELWINYLFALKKRDIPVLLVSARVRENSSFFNSLFAPLYKQAFRGFRHVFTQDERSATLIGEFSGKTGITVSSDTRYDRVVSNREGFTEIEVISRFKQGRFCLVGGSTWPKGEQLLFEAFAHFNKTSDICMILAPHEIHQARIEKWVAQFPDVSIRFSAIEKLQPAHRILWIDNIGMLSRLYHYADVAYVGGGWGTGLHNILEAAIFGCPVIFGPAHHKFPEADELIEAGGGFSIHDQEGLNATLQKMIADTEHRQQIKRINTTFIHKRAGATKTIMEWCQVNEIL